jgi:hypothetical protein
MKSLAAETQRVRQFPYARQYKTVIGKCMQTKDATKKHSSKAFLLCVPIVAMSLAGAFTQSKKPKQSWSFIIDQRDSDRVVLLTLWKTCISSTAREAWALEVIIS